MPFIKLQFRPGLNRDQTNYSGEGGWYDCDKIRFRSGYPEKVGGWKKATPTNILGVCRQMWNWITSFSDNLLALGTNKKVYIEAGGNFFDITPLRATFDTPDTDNCVDVSNGSELVVFNVTGHGALSGDYVTVIGVTGSGSPAAIGGIPVSEINGNHEVTVIDPDSFSILVSTAATSTVSNAGGTAIELQFEIEPGNAILTAGYGWGTGTWSRGTWGLGSTQPVFLLQRDWWFDNFDNDLVMNIRNGPVYYWERGTIADPSTSLDTRAKLLSELADDAGYDPDDVPAAVMQVLVSQQDKHLLAFGAVPFGSTTAADFDPLLIRWADQDNPFQWEPLPTNSAGFLRVSRGSRIVRALPTRQEILVWTDTHLYTMQFLGTTDVFSLQEYADNISIASPRACASASNITYWMGQDKFYAYTGRVETLPCTIRNYIFQNINFQQADQIVCGTNEEWNEVWWFYPSASSNWNDRYVVYNHLERLWYYGTIERTAWLDTPLRQFPQAVSTNEATVIGTLYNHEDGVDDDIAPMVSYIQSNDFDLEEGDKFLLTRRMIPDVNFDGSETATPEVELVIRPRNFPGSTYQNDVADTQRVVRTSVDVYTDQVFMRARARQMAFKIQSDSLGVQWQLGSPRLDVRPDGQR
jgi:hypothetical protein